MTAPELVFLAAARAELHQAFDWYHARSPRAAVRFLVEVDKATLLIRETPTLWPAFEAGTRRYVLSGFPYSVFFREVGAALQVLAVAHHKRRPGDWHSRPDAADEGPPVDRP